MSDGVEFSFVSWLSAFSSGGIIGGGSRILKVFSEEECFCRFEGVLGGVGKRSEGEHFCRFDGVLGGVANGSVSSVPQERLADLDESAPKDTVSIQKQYL